MVEFPSRSGNDHAMPLIDRQLTVPTAKIPTSMQTLYEKIGGQATVEKLVVAFYQNVLSDPLLKPFFEHTSVERLKTMQIAFFTIALGGPEPEMKISLFESHRGRGIERKHLTRFTEHLVATLKEIGIEESSAKRVYERIATYADEILGDASVDG